jgi:hypothetical protein
MQKFTDVSEKQPCSHHIQNQFTDVSEKQPCSHHIQNRVHRCFRETAVQPPPSKSDSMSQEAGKRAERAAKRKTQVFLARK